MKVDAFYANWVGWVQLILSQIPKHLKKYLTHIFGNKLATHYLATLLGDNSRLVRSARAVRERVLLFAYGRLGLVRVVNGTPLRVLPAHRWTFTSQYDANVARYFRQRVRPGATCLSIGANLGIYPLQFAYWSAPNGKVYAFEPNPETAALLRRHVALNGFTERIQVIEAAVAEQPGQAMFFATGTDGMSRLGEANPALQSTAATLAVAVESLDHFLKSSSVNPDFMMIDIEGFEIAALRGARNLFAKYPPKGTVVEMHPNAWSVAGTDRAAMEAVLADYKLRMIPLSGQADPLAEYGHVALEPAGP